MNKFANAFKSIENQTVTENGNFAYKDTRNSLLDMFFRIGSLRPVSETKSSRKARTVQVLSSNEIKKARELFGAALKEDKVYALRILFWLRDAREGAGERELFRVLFKDLMTFYPDDAEKLFQLIPEYGRFDDLWNSVDLNNAKHCAKLGYLLGYEFRKDPNKLGLLAKWLPRPKGKNLQLARKLASLMGFHTEKQYRRFLVNNTQVVENQMSKKAWNDIDFSHVPSKAMVNYTKAYKKNANISFSEYVANLKQGKTKINAGAIYPYEIIKAMNSFGDKEAFEEQWKALPNYIKEGINILPVIDVSSSMKCKATNTVTCMDIAIGLGMYCAERQSGPFKNLAVTFSNHPEFIDLARKNSLYEKYKMTRWANWDGNTDIAKVFDLILDVAKRNYCKQYDLPDYVLILSDMQFDQCCNRNDKDIVEMYREQFAQYGYQLPNIIFWNLNGRYNNVPATMRESGTVLVSGFSPSIMKAVTYGEIDPMSMMHRTILSKRYDAIENALK